MNVDKRVYQAMDIKRLKVAVKQDPWRLNYHLMPPTGWMNDPNGLCQFQGIYHVYYQYSPDDVDGQTKLWGHYTSTDMLVWKEQEPVLFEDCSYDRGGVYSGSAFVNKDRIHYFYTGNVKLIGDYDYIKEGREQNTIHVTSEDGFHFSEKERILGNQDYPSDMSCHVRDPKIIEFQGIYYMILGARDNASQGCVLVYRSSDLQAWSYAFRIACEQEFGYMWECPDLFELDGEYFLICCPQGLSQEGIHYANVHQCGYFPIDINFDTGEYTCKAFQELDHGFDFYAPQTFQDERGRRIMIGWMGMPDIPYTNPTISAGWQHALTMPRQLHVRNHRIVQSPLEEMHKLRYDKRIYSAQTKEAVQVASSYEVSIQFVQAAPFRLQLSMDTYLCYDTKICTLDMGESGYGRDERSVLLSNMTDVVIYRDASSLEIFLNGGMETFTSRVYDKGIQPLRMDTDTEYRMEVYKLRGFMMEELQ